MNEPEEHEIEREIDANTPEGRQMAERAFFASAVAMPEGYTRCGLAFTHPHGSRLFICGADVPAMFWNGYGWTRINERLDG